MTQYQYVFILTRTKEVIFIYQLLFILFALFIITLTYTYIASRLTKNKLILTIPTTIALLYYLLQWREYLKAPAIGFENLSIYFATLFIIVVVLTNLFFSFIFLKKKNKLGRN